VGLFKAALIVLAALPLNAQEASADSATAHLLYLAQQGEIDRAIESYRTFVASSGTQDFELLRNLGRIILRQGQFARSEAGRLLALYGAGIAQDGDLFDVIRSGLYSSSAEAQLVAIDLLDRLYTDQANDLLMAAMGSEFLLPRLEAGLRLVEKGYPPAIAQLQALLVKVIPELHPVFCELFARAEDAEADRILRQLMATGSPEVQRAAALSVGRLGRDDFLPEIRRLLRRLDPLQQEVAAVAVGQLHDSVSIDRLRELTQSQESCVQVAALQALSALGDEAAATGLKDLALQGDFFAICCLGQLEGAEEQLAELARYPDLQVRLNAAIALLERRDNRCIGVLSDILVSGAADRGLAARLSAGGGLTCFEVVSSLEARSQKSAELKEASNSLREALLREALELDEASFLMVAKALFAAAQNELMPLLVRLLENKSTPAALALLEQECEHAGAPLIRTYCHLALFRHDPTGPHGAPLREWVARQAHHPLLELRPIRPWTKRRKSEEFSLNPEETSRLLIEVYEALTEQRDLAAIDSLLDGIQHGHADNRYVLAALLMRAAE
jgi:hypothetical protein